MEGFSFGLNQEYKNTQVKQVIPTSAARRELLVYENHQGFGSSQIMESAGRKQIITYNRRLFKIR